MGNVPTGEMSTEFFAMHSTVGNRASSPWWHEEFSSNLHSWNYHDSKTFGVDRKSAKIKNDVELGPHQQVSKHRKGPFVQKGALFWDSCASIWVSSRSSRGWMDLQTAFPRTESTSSWYLLFWLTYPHNDCHTSSRSRTTIADMSRPLKV